VRSSRRSSRLRGAGRGRRLQDCEASVLITGRRVPCGAARCADEGRRRRGPSRSPPSVKRVLVIRRLGDRARGDSVEPEPGSLVDHGMRRPGWRSSTRNGPPPAPDHRPRRPTCSSTPRHDRPTQGSRPRPRRVPDQGGPGSRPHVRPAGRRRAVLVHRPRLDDGPVGDLGVAHARCPLVLFEAPRLPRPDRLWDLVARHGVTHLG